MKFSFLVLTVALSASLLPSCKKGDDGPPGTANVKYSEWFVAAPWKKDTIFGVFGFNFYKDAPDITQEILDKGTVLTFAKLMGYNSLVWKPEQVGQLPISLTYLQGTIMTDTWSASAFTDSVKIRFVNDKNLYNSIATQHEFRYVIIPGGLPAGRGVSLSYKEICQLYNIPE